MGKVEFLKLYPLNFREFLLAEGEAGYHKEEWMTNVPLYALVDYLNM